MRYLLLLTTIAALPNLAEAKQLKVVATVTDLAAIAKQIGGDHVDVVPLALGTQDPHFVDARPHLALELSRADLLIAVGLDLELGWLPTLQTGSRNGNIQNGASGFLDCSQFVKRLDIPAVKLDRSMGDIHPGGNPHYLYDPRAAADCGKGIMKKMAEIDPEHAKIFEANYENFAKKLQEFRLDAEKRLSALRGMKVIAYHKTLTYLSDWLGFVVVDHIEPRPGIPPNPAHVARLLSLAKSQGVKAILVETYYPETTAKLIAGKCGATLIRVHGGADFRNGETYFDHLKHIVAAFEATIRSGG